MNEPTMQTLVQRLERVERENHLWKRTGAFVLAGIAGVLLLGQAAPTKGPKQITAERFVLLDASGNPRATLGMGLRETVRLALTDKNGNTRVMLGTGPIDDREARLNFYNEAGNRRVELGIGPADLSSLYLYDRSGKPSVWVTTLLPGFPMLALFDKTGAMRAALKVELNGSPTLRLLDKDAKPRAALGAIELKTIKTGAVEKRPTSSLVLFGDEGKAIWSAP